MSHDRFFEWQSTSVSMGLQNSTKGSYTCDRGVSTLVPAVGEWSEDGQGGDGLTPWTDGSGNEWTFTPGTNSVGEEIVTISGLDPASPLEGTVVGNEIIVPDPSNPENPIIGTISSDGKIITWTQDGDNIDTTGRIDINECTDPASTDPCVSQTDTTCFNTDPGYSCNCNIADADSLTGTDRWEWNDATGTLVTIGIVVNNNVAEKAGVTYTLSDGTTTTGTLLGNDVTFINADGSERTGTITKNADGTQTITWDNTDVWNRVEPAPSDPANPGTPVATTPGTSAAATPATPAAGTTPATPAAATPVTPAQALPPVITTIPPFPEQSASGTPAPATPVPTPGQATIAGSPVTAATGSVTTAAPVPVASGTPGVIGVPVVPVNPPSGSSGSDIIGTSNNPSSSYGTATGDPHFRIRNWFQVVYLKNI